MKPKAKAKPKPTPGSAPKRGRGRPRHTVPSQVLAKLGPPPTGAERLQEWSSRLASEIVWLEANGQIGAALAAALRAGIGTIGRSARGVIVSAEQVSDLAEDSDDPDIEIEPDVDGDQVELRVTPN